MQERASGSEWIKSLRGRLGLTQEQFARQVGVSFATVNRWENSHYAPTPLARKRIVELEGKLGDSDTVGMADGAETPGIDFGAQPEVVRAVSDAAMLSFGHLTNPAFAAEISAIDTLPHQRIAVYDHMLKQDPLRFLLADDAGAGKTIMTGLYIREMMFRRLIRRVMVVAPAGLLGNWEREMRTLFRLPFRIVRGEDAQSGNPFVGREGDLAIVSIDTLAGERMFDRLRDAACTGAAPGYDLVVFDEAHKLSARQEKSGSIRKTDRYRLAEAIAGAESDDRRWRLGWSAPHLLLLTATPHMGKDFPYFCLWRLLEPLALSTPKALEVFPEAERRKRFIRRTKEELVRFDGEPLYPQRQCDTLEYDLNPDELALYESMTSYIKRLYDRTASLNSSAAGLVMSVFQRRLASSSFALRRSLERRMERLEEAAAMARAGSVNELQRRSSGLRNVADYFEHTTADEDTEEPGRSRGEQFERRVLGGFLDRTADQLQEECDEVRQLLVQARDLEAAGVDSKFARLRELIEDREFAGEKLIVFTEHRDTAEFLVTRLEALGFGGRVALVHGGLDYREREAAVERFRRPTREGGAGCLIATDAAGEGINLQFCWRMVNYDIPWNPARLEQRMGRIHRYGQKHDPVVIVNLVAHQTREGRVMKVLIEKLETIRQELSSDKVFDVLGRMLRGVSISEHMRRAVVESEDAASDALNAQLTARNVHEIDEADCGRFGKFGVEEHLQVLRARRENERGSRLLPGNVRYFLESAAGLMDLSIEGDLDEVFRFAPESTRQDDRILDAIANQPPEVRSGLTVHRRHGNRAIWLHPGEAVFDTFCEGLISRFGSEALRGAVFADAAADEPYLVHMVRLTILRREATGAERTSGSAGDQEEGVALDPIETRLAAVRQDSNGAIRTCSLKQLLVLRGDHNAAPGQFRISREIDRHRGEALHWIQNGMLADMAKFHREQLERALPEQERILNRAFNLQAADLAARRKGAGRAVETGDAEAEEENAALRERQQRLGAEKEHSLAQLMEGPSRCVAGRPEFIAHALVVPTVEEEEQAKPDSRVEMIAMRIVQAHEIEAGARVQDVSTKDLAVRAGLIEDPGFDLRSVRKADDAAEEEIRYIEVKGRAESGKILISENEWRTACSQRDRYWLYVVYGCATDSPQLIKIQDPFSCLTARPITFLVSKNDILTAANSTRERT